MPHLSSICYKPHDAPARKSGYTRVGVLSAELVAGYGIRNDRKGGSPNRHINVMAEPATQALGADGFQCAPGDLGEQLVVSGLDVNSLKPGDRLRIGNSAVLEMAEPRTGCGKFERYQGKSRDQAAGRLGMMARVVCGGTISVGDEVEPEAELADV